MHLLIIGRGKLGRAITSTCIQRGIKHSTSDGGNVFTNEPDGTPNIAVYCGVGNLWEEVLDDCEKNGMPLINASTVVKDPVDRKIKYVKVPNTSLPMVHFMAVTPDYLRGFMEKGMQLDMIETHQSDKKGKSGTAKAIADKLGFNHDDIIDVRKKGLQRILGVPENVLDKHASHFFVLSDGRVRITIKTEIVSHDTYADGLIHIANKVHAQAADLVFGNNPVGKFI